MKIRLAEENAFILNHIVYKNGLGKLVQQSLLPWTFKTPFSVSNVGNIPKTNFLDTSQGPIKLL